MNLHQFRFVQETVRRDLNLTEAAKALHTSQPGISKAIIELEEELGVDVFVRHGKRIKRVTEPGQQVLGSIQIILREVENLKRIGAEFATQDAGTLSIATTHTQARYVLPEPVAAVRREYPKVMVNLQQGTPSQVAQLLLSDRADIGVATESLSDFDELVTLPCYEWQHVLVMPIDHPLASLERISLSDLVQHPLVTYNVQFTGRGKIDAAFAAQKLVPKIALEAIDSDVIRTYVRLGLGVGILAEMAANDSASLPLADQGLVARPAGYLFGSNVTRVAFKRGAYLRGFVYSLAQHLSPRLTRHLVNTAMKGGTSNYML
jgi:LysR family transcriptional regulator, cys regulon transcriptional activator